jgi:hypothetical protein
MLYGRTAPSCHDHEDKEQTSPRKRYEPRVKSMAPRQRENRYLQYAAGTLSTSYPINLNTAQPAHRRPQGTTGIPTAEHLTLYKEESTAPRRVKEHGCHAVADGPLLCETT